MGVLGLGVDVVPVVAGVRDEGDVFRDPTGVCARDA